MSATDIEFLKAACYQGASNDIWPKNQTLLHMSTCAKRRGVGRKRTAHSVGPDQHDYFAYNSSYLHPRSGLDSRLSSVHELPLPPLGEIS